MSDPDPNELKAKFIEERGYWNPIWDDLLAADPAFFQAYAEFSSVPTRDSALDPKTRELIYIAIDASVTHMYAPGTQVHIRNALALGASPREILEVLELISVLGIHALTMGLPLLNKEVERQARKAAENGGEDA